ncbi:MAG: peptidase C39 family protein [Chloroflexota bacterium]
MMKNKILAFARITLVSVIMLSMVSSVSAKGKGDGAYQTGFTRWRAADNGFGGWSLNGVKLNAGGALEFNSATAGTGSDPYAAGAYNGGNYYNGGSFSVGEATSPEITTPFNYKEAIASWNASTPAGTWMEVQFRAQYGGTRWSKWYILGIWASDYSTINRHSVKLQGDTDGFVAVDTFVSSSKKETTNKFQLKLRLFSEDGILTPTVQNASVAYSTETPKSAGVSAGNPELWNTLLNTPEYSQMVYPDGGEVWCSPTSTSMVLADLDNYTGLPEPRVRAAVDDVFDWIYDGHGNWPFNTAYAAREGVYEGYVARFTSLESAERFVAVGVPVIMSIAWAKGDLTNSDIDSTNGHLLVLVGFDEAGNPIVNDPASPANATVQRTYLRSEFEPLWLEASGGTVYLIYPQGASVPAIP